MQQTLLSRREINDLYLGKCEIPAQSELLTQFYRVYAGWLVAGAPEGVIFTRSSGLCQNLKMYLLQTGKSDRQTVTELGMEMRRQFINARRNDAYPFDGHSDSYQRSAGERNCHANENRIKWVNEHAE